jgi:hypothetical protein
VRARLARLREAGYLRAERVYDEERRNILAYRLADRALPELRNKNQAVTQREVYKPPERTAHQLLHSLMVSECAVRVIESIRDSDLVAPALAPLGLPFYHARVVAEPGPRRSVQRFVTQDEVEIDGRGYSIAPDLVFALRRGERERLFLVEADRGGEGYSELQRKVRAYGAYERSLCGRGGCKYSDVVRDVRVLLVALSGVRIKGVLAHLAATATPGAELLRCAPLEIVRGANMVFDAPWLRLEPDGSLASGPMMRRKTSP